MLPVESFPPGWHLVYSQVNDRQIGHYVAEGDEDGELETDAEGEGELEGDADTEADGEGDAEGEADAEVEGLEDGLLDADAEAMTVPRFPSAASHR